MIPGTPQDPNHYVTGEYPFHGTREQWLALAHTILDALDPVKKEEVPELLRRIAEALDAT